MIDHINPQGLREFSEGEARVVLYPNCVELHQPTQVRTFPKPINEEELRKRLPFSAEDVREIYHRIIGN